MARNKLKDVRDHLFETMEMVKSGEMEIERAQTVANLAGVLVETAKVEVAFLKQVGGIGSDFIAPMREDQKLLK